MNTFLSQIIYTQRKALRNRQMNQSNFWLLQQEEKERSVRAFEKQDQDYPALADTLAINTRCNFNSPDVVEGRHEYANWFLEEANIHRSVFIVEHGFNIWTARSQGRARVGQRACLSPSVWTDWTQPYNLLGGVSSFRFGALHCPDGLDDQRIIH